jgi:hypothetical protein
MKWHWILWQVLAPIFGPIAISIGVVLLWQTGNPNFRISWPIILDVSPWALTFYCFTLIGTTMNDLWPNFKDRPILVIGLIVVALMVAIYASFMVIWRHDPNFRPGTNVYVVTFIFLGISIPLCYAGAKV